MTSKGHWVPSLPILYLLLQEKQKIYLKILGKNEGKISRDFFENVFLRDNWLDCVYLVLTLKSPSCIFWLRILVVCCLLQQEKESFYLITFENSKWDFRSALLEDFWSNCVVLDVLVSIVGVKCYWTSFLLFATFHCRKKGKLFLKVQKLKKIFQWNNFIRLFVKDF